MKCLAPYLKSNNMNQIFYIKCTKTIKGMNYKNALDSLNNWKLVEVGKQLGLINFCLITTIIIQFLLAKI